MEKLTSINLKSIVAKINELIELAIDNSKNIDNSELVKRVKALEDKPQYKYDDRELVRRISGLEGTPQYRYDDKSIKDRITALENKPAPKQKEFDDSEILAKIDKINESLVSLDKRIDFIRRTYSEKWQQAEFERAKFQKEVGDQISKIETPQEIDLSEFEGRIDNLESIEHVAYDDSAIKKSISDIKKSIPQPVNLGGLESRLKKLEDKPNYFYNDKSVLKQIDSIKSELSDIKKSLNEIFE